jgi:hypothetical protein
MSIGSTITVSAPSVGTTTHTLDKRSAGDFAVSLTPVVSYPDVPMVVSLRPASADGKYRQFGATLKYNPSTVEDEVNPSLGSFTVSVNCNAKLGTVITETEAKQLLVEGLSVLVQSAIYDALMDGSTE